MPGHFFDTSALSKHYHPEPGTVAVDGWLSAPGVTPRISRLTVVEIQSVFAKKVRTGAITATDFQLLCRQFRKDVAAKRLAVVRVTTPHFQRAEELIRRLAAAQNLRTLDALQLAVALSLNEPDPPVSFVCADSALCAVAAAEGLTVLNPEAP